jgi:hypothetical protein
MTQPNGPIIAIFDAERDMDAALSLLYSRGYRQDQIKLISPQDVATGAAPAAIDTVGATLSGTPRLTYNPIVVQGMMAGAGESEPVVNLRTDLLAMGIAEQDIPRFFKALREGAFVVIANAGPEQAGELHRLLAESGADFIV